MRVTACRHGHDVVHAYVHVVLGESRERVQVKSEGLHIYVKVCIWVRTLSMMHFMVACSCYRRSSKLLLALLLLRMRLMLCVWLLSAWWLPGQRIGNTITAST